MIYYENDAENGHFQLKRVDFDSKMVNFEWKMVDLNSKWYILTQILG